jgi:membrane protein involved in colicin uptake
VSQVNAKHNNLVDLSPASPAALTAVTAIAARLDPIDGIDLITAQYEVDRAQGLAKIEVSRQRVAKWRRLIHGMHRRTNDGFTRFEQTVVRINRRIAQESAAADQRRRLDRARAEAVASAAQAAAERSARRKADKAARRIEAERRAAELAEQKAERLRQFRARHLRNAVAGMSA